MTRPGLSGKQHAPTFQHTNAEEYTAFVREYTSHSNYRAELLRFRKNFVQQYPHWLDWFAAPLPERIGCLHRETRLNCHCLTSFQARH